MIAWSREHLQPGLLTLGLFREREITHCTVSPLSKHLHLGSSLLMQVNLNVLSILAPFVLLLPVTTSSFKDSMLSSFPSVWSSSETAILSYLKAQAYASYLTLPSLTASFLRKCAKTNNLLHQLASGQQIVSNMWPGNQPEPYSGPGSRARTKTIFGSRWKHWTGLGQKPCSSLVLQWKSILWKARWPYKHMNKLHMNKLFKV